MKHSVTLYRIKSGARVSQAYRMMTDDDITVPSDYTLQGVNIHENFQEWLENYIIPVLERHNGERIVDAWAVPMNVDPDHVTVAMCVDDIIVAPDLLLNTTSWNDRPRVHLLMNEAIHKAICKYEPNRKIVLPDIDNDWWLDQESRIMNKPAIAR